MQNKKCFLITVDVEDWFQVENFKPWIPYETWDHRELRVERNVHRLLDLFDTAGTRIDIPRNRAPLNPGAGRQYFPVSRSTRCGINTTGGPGNIRATFFVLGWIARRLPHLVREIGRRGHEVASHGIDHLLSNSICMHSLSREITGSKTLLEDITGSPVTGFRAPSFSINEQALDLAKAAGYRYDSSYNSFGLHRRYGKISVAEQNLFGIAYKISDNFYELPVSNMKLSGKTFPWGGGAYFRFIPGCLFRWGVRNLLKKQGSYLFYLHPWEIDPHQPRMKSASLKNRIKHYHNLKHTAGNLEKLIASFPDCTFLTCSRYLESVCHA